MPQGWRRHHAALTPSSTPGTRRCRRARRTRTEWPRASPAGRSARRPTPRRPPRLTDQVQDEEHGRQADGAEQLPRERVRLVRGRHDDARDRRLEQRQDGAAARASTDNHRTTRTSSTSVRRSAGAGGTAVAPTERCRGPTMAASEPLYASPRLRPPRRRDACRTGRPPTSSSWAPARPAGGPRCSPGSAARNASWSWKARPARARPRARPASSARRAARRRRSRSACGRSTSIGPNASGTDDSGFRELGYLILATDEAQEAGGARARVEMQRAAGLTDVRYVDAAEAARLNPTLIRPRSAAGPTHPGTGASIRRGTCAPSLAMQRAGVELRERTAFLGIERSSAGDVIGVETTGGAIATERVRHRRPDAPRGRGARRRPVLRGRRPSPGRGHGAPRGVRRRAPADGLRERGGPLLALEEGGLLFGMSNPDEAPGPAREVDWPYLREMETRVRRYAASPGPRSARRGPPRSSTARTICRWSGRSGRATARRSRA